MTPTQLELTRLIGKKELSFGCLVKNYRGIGRFIEIVFPFALENFYRISIDNCTYEVGLGSGSMISNDIIIGHPATLSDFHRMLASLEISFTQQNSHIEFEGGEINDIDYNSSLELINQPVEVQEQLIRLIKSVQ